MIQINSVQELLDLVGEEPQFQDFMKSCACTFRFLVEDVSHAKYCADAILKNIGSAYLAPQLENIKSVINVEWEPFQHDKFYVYTIVCRFANQNPLSAVFYHLQILTTRINCRDAFYEFFTTGLENIKTIKSETTLEFGEKK